MNILFLHSRLSLEGEPLGLMQIISVVKSHNHQVKLTLLNEPYLKHCREFAPDLIAASVMSSDAALFNHAFHKIKENFPQIPIIIGGAHPTFMPDCITSMPIDAICRGEGDDAIIEVLDHLKAGKSITENNILNISTTECANNLRPLIIDLDRLPAVDRDLVYNKSKALLNFPLRTFYTSRGCPFKCTYCFNHAYHTLYKNLGPVVRRRSIENIIEEMRHVTRKYPTKFIKIADDAFVHRVDDWIEEFSRQYKKEIKLPFYCLLRADVVTPSLVTLLREAGCVSVCMSIETGNEKIRREVLNRQIDNKKIIAAFDLFNKAGIKIYTNSLLALPNSTLDDDYATIDLNIRCKPALGHFTIMAPFPGTVIHDLCARDNLIPKQSEETAIPTSVGTKSVLSCFTKQEKNIQKNLLLLGPLIVCFPFLKNFKFLLSLPENIVYKMVYFFTKNLLFKKHIVPINLSIKQIYLIATAQIRELLIQTGHK